MKIVREIPKEYNAIQFDVEFVKKYGLIKYPMVRKDVVPTQDGFIFETTRREDILGKLFGLRETVKVPKKAKRTVYFLSKIPVDISVIPFAYTYPKEIHDGDWIVTDQNGNSKVYTAEEFDEYFMRK